MRLPPVALREPEDTCMRCGRATAAGVSLCELHNPGHIKAPSSTQVHGTILVGVVAGFIVLLWAARFAVGGGGPFTAAIQGRATLADGGISIAVRVTNAGSSEAPADCRVSRDGTARQDDVDFRTPTIAAGGTVDVTRSLPVARDGQPVYDIERVTVRCT